MDDLIKVGADLVKCADQMMLMLAGEVPLTKITIERALRKTLDARNAWDNAVKDEKVR